MISYFPYVFCYFFSFAADCLLYSARVNCGCWLDVSGDFFALMFEAEMLAALWPEFANLSFLSAMATIFFALLALRCLPIRALRFESPEQETGQASHQKRV